MAYLGCVAAGLVFLVLFGAFERRTELMWINDFSGIWTGGRGLVLGADPYDSATWRSVVAEIGTQTPDTAVYGYPAWVAIAFVPLALLPLEIASWMWTLATLALAILAVRALLRTFAPGFPLAHALAGLVLTMSTPAYHAFVLGQWGFALVAVIASGTVLLRQGRDVAGAAVLVGFLAKPQLFLAAPFGLIRTKAAALTFAALATGTALTASVLLPFWWSAWLAEVPAGRLQQPATIYSLLTELVGPPGRFIGVAVAAVAIALASRFAFGSDASRAVWLAVSMVVAPYVWAYDHLLLLVPIVIGVGVIARRDHRLAVIVVCAGALVLLLGSLLLYVIAVTRGRETWSAIVPVVVAGLLIASMWAGRASGGGERTEA